MLAEVWSIIEFASCLILRSTFHIAKFFNHSHIVWLLPRSITSCYWFLSKLCLQFKQKTAQIQNESRVVKKEENKTLPFSENIGAIYNLGRVYWIHLISSLFLLSYMFIIYRYFLIMIFLHHVSKKMSAIFCILTIACISCIAGTAFIW